MNSPFALLSLIIAIPFFGLLFALTAKDEENDEIGGRNAFYVCVFSIMANILLIWRIFMVIDEKKQTVQLFEHFSWLQSPKIDITFGVDTFALILILAVHIAVLIGVIGVRSNIYKQKSLMIFTLLFLSMITGFFVSADIFSFYIFFEAMLLPLYMLIGMFGEVRKQSVVNRFFLYNFLGAIILFAVTMYIYKHHGSVTLEKLAKLRVSKEIEFYVWAAVFVSFLSRIPIWPFHYWISSVSSGIRNPLVFIISSLLPLTGIYGFIRFLPDKSSLPVELYGTWINIIGIITMMFISLIGLINKDSQYKLFAYVTVYYIMYLIGALTTDALILMNIGFSVFSFLIIFAGMSVLSGYIYRKQESYQTNEHGFLCRVPRLSFIYSYLTIAAIGMPLSAVFINNFLILSKLLESNIRMGMLLIGTLFLVGATLLQELYKLKLSNAECPISSNDDISKKMFYFMLFVIFILLMSFIRPLWFVVG